jgi:pectate lyase
VTLPSDPALGGGDTQSSSPLIGGDYGAGQGPGIALVARDGFRLYQNEKLVAERTASLEPVFVPLTFLPGDNVVSVVVASPDRSPAVLVHVDELEREYLSDTSWKVSTSPEEDFRLPGYDASDWDDARDHGLAVATSGCAPPAGFIPGSTAHWIGVDDESARTAVFRLEIPIAPLGFGADTTGGADAEPVVPADANQLAMLLSGDTPNVVLLPEGSWDLTELGPIEPACPLPCDDGSGKITYFALSGGQTCDGATRDIQRNERRVSFGWNKTLVGLGRGAILRGAWLTLEDAENVIVRNVAVYDVNPEIIEAGDAVSINTSSRVWLDHMTFRWIGDGFVDVADSSGVTLSWIRFDGRSEFACQNHHPRANELSISQATIHHSFYDTVIGRAPQVNRGGSEVHVANNVVNDNPDYAVGAACSAEILLEGSYFENVAFPTNRRDCTDDTSIGRILAPADSNYYDPATTGPHRLSGADSPEPRDPVFPLSYVLPLDSIVDVRGTVPLRAGAGSRWPLPFEL